MFIVDERVIRLHHPQTDDDWRFAVDHLHQCEFLVRYQTLSNSFRSFVASEIRVRSHSFTAVE